MTSHNEYQSKPFLRRNQLKYLLLKGWCTCTAKTVCRWHNILNESPLSESETKSDVKTAMFHFSDKVPSLKSLDLLHTILAVKHLLLEYLICISTCIVPMQHNIMPLIPLI